MASYVEPPESWGSRLLEASRESAYWPQRAEKGVLDHELTPGELWGEVVGTVE